MELLAKLGEHSPISKREKYREIDQRDDQELLRSPVSQDQEFDERSRRGSVVSFEFDIAKYTVSNISFEVVELYRDASESHFRTTSRELYHHLRETFRAEYSMRATKHMNFPELTLRDIRAIDWFLNPVISCNIIVRKYCILLGLDPLRVIITAGRIIFLISSELKEEFYTLFLPISHAISGKPCLPKVFLKFPFMMICIYVLGWYEAQTNLGDKSDTRDEPFELYCMEAVFAAIQSVHTQNIKLCTQEIKSWLQDFDNKILVPIEFGESMRKNKMELSKLKVYVENAKDRITKLLDDENELMWMNVSTLAGKERALPSSIAPPQKPTNDTLQLTDIVYHETSVTHSTAESMKVTGGVLLDRMRNTDTIEILLESILIEFNSLQIQTTTLLHQMEFAQETVSGSLFCM
jgi:hypothetical protein